jgi:hypothetical protein
MAICVSYVASPKKIWQSENKLCRHYRFGHSLITSQINMMKGDLSNKPVKLSNNFFNTTLVCEGKLSELLMGMCFQGAEIVNNVVSDGIRNRLFPHSRNSPFGGDLVVRNIMVRNIMLHSWIV